MPALPTVVTDFLTSIKNSLSQGSDLGSNVTGAAQNYLRAQDMATVLELLQDAMDQTATMTVVDAVGDTATTRSFQDGAQSTETLTLTGLAIDGQIVTIDSKVYTWQDTLTDVDGNVHIGTDAAECVANLVGAITLTSGTPGTDYATSMTLHPTFTALDGAGDTVEIYAKVSGAAANGTTTTENGTNMSWGAATSSGGADAFGPEEMVGNVVVFASATTTAALRDVEARVSTNTEGQLTFDSELPATPVNGDTYTVRGGWFDSQLSELREDKSLADSPSGSVYGDHRSVVDALVTALRRRGAHASEVLTFSGLAIDTQTVTIDAKVYTWQDTLTDSDGNVQIGGTAEACIDNLVGAITLTGVAGTDYAASMTLHPTASAVKTTASTMTARAKLVGTSGNSLATTETGTNTAWGDTTMSGGLIGGTGTVAERTMSRPGLQTAAGSTTTVVQLEQAGLGSYRIDQWRGMKMVVGSETARIVSSSDETSVTVSPALSSAPSAATAVTMTIPEDAVAPVAPKLRVHPGGQPGENAMLSDLINQVQTIMESYILPV
jgi:hypothetical protein